MPDIHVHVPAALLRKPVRDAVFDPSKRRNLNTETPREAAARRAYSQKTTPKKVVVYLKTETGKKWKETMRLGGGATPEQVAQGTAEMFQRNSPNEKISVERFEVKDESPETKERHEGALNEKETAMASEHVEHREDTPPSVFLMPAARKYPVKTKQDGEYKYDRGLLLAAAREARMHGHGALADRADAIREREFGAKE